MEEKNMRELSLEELEGVAAGRGGSPTPLPPKAGCIVYQIRRGDVLPRIARKYGTTVGAIKAVNPMIYNVNDITAGYYIYVPEC